MANDRRSLEGLIALVQFGKVFAVMGTNGERRYFSFDNAPKWAYSAKEDADVTIGALQREIFGLRLM